jgi:hypothetical protein
MRLEEFYSAVVPYSFVPLTIMAPPGCRWLSTSSCKHVPFALGK